MKIKGLLKDLLGSFRLLKMRKKEIKEASEHEIPDDIITNLAKELHPGRITVTVSDIKQETKDSKRIRLSSPLIPYFPAGTYLSLTLKIGESLVNRSYSIITSPIKAYENKYVEIIVKDYKDGFVSSYLNHELKVNDEIEVEIGLGQFYYMEYRDKKDLVAIAGGVGITPFISMAHDIIDRNLDLTLTILYGSENPNEIIAKEELENLHDERIKVIHVISGNYQTDYEKGFITKEIIEKYTKKDSSFFICGPKIMFDNVIKELGKIDIDLRRIRKESFPISDITKEEGFDIKLIDKTFNIEVHQGILITNIKAKANESIATALERSGLKIHTACKAGECGFCRLHILKGTYFIPNSHDYRRYTDKEFNYVHACVTYPTSDLIIKINLD